MGTKVTKGSRRIRDRDVCAGNYAVFSQCETLHNGRLIRFRYPSGDIYDVSLRDILSWYDHPHYLWTSAGVKAWPCGKTRMVTPVLHAKMVRRVLRGHALRVYMSNHTAYDVAWDTVLMACEPRYEWFGGLTAEIRGRLSSV